MFRYLTLAIVAFCFIMTSCSPKINTARIVLLPDTQTYAEKYPEILDSQLSWIAREGKNINFVLQQGDLTQNNNEVEWERVEKAFAKIDNKIPYVLAAGNHDMGSVPGKFADTRNTDMYNQYFPTSKLSSIPGFGGVAEEGKSENAYFLFSTDKVKWLVITLEFGPRNSILNWANSIVQKHPDHLVIVNTHSYMYSDSTRQGPGDNWRPQAYGVGKDLGDSTVNDGEDIWQKLIRKNKNILFVFSGHVLNSGVGTLVSINDAGYPVYQMLANYQEGVRGSTKGGNGWLRIVDLNLRKKTINISTYSPFLNQYKQEPAHEFVIKNVLFKPVR